jgi:hypothetical protein
MRRSPELLSAFFVVASLCCAIQRPVMADEKPTICTGGAGETPDGCSEKIEAWVNGSGAQELTEETVAPVVRKEAAKINTGPSAVAVGSGASTTNDYIPFIQALLGTSPGSGDEGDNLGLEFSNFLPLPDSIQHKAAVQLLGSKLYDPLASALAEAALQAEQSALEDQVASSDDMSLSISISRSNEETGRSPAQHSGLFHALLAASVRPNARLELARRAYNSLLEEIELRTRNETDPAKKFTRGELDSGFGALPAEDLDRVLVAYEQMELASHADLVLIRDNLRASGFYDALELLSNNPQWSFVANYRSRDELAGPDEWTATVRYEIGWPSLRQAQKELGCADDACVASKFSTFILSPSTRRSRNSSPRFAFNLSYTERARYDFLLPSSTFAFSRESVSSLVGGISYGMFLTGTPSDPNRIRLDIAANYEDVSDDPAKNDRGVANLTFTYPIGGGTFLSIGAVYATKPEYRGDVDEELNARAGLLYKFAGSGP